MYLSIAGEGIVLEQFNSKSCTMNIDTVLTKEQNKLIKIAKTKGLYENFGQKEVRKLEDKFINLSDYSEEMNKNRRLIQMFDEWCMNYCG